MENTNNSNGCTNTLVGLFGVLMVLGVISKIMMWIFGIGGSIDRSDVTDSTLEYKIKDIRNLFEYDYAMYNLDQSKVGEIIKLTGEVEYVNRDDEYFINFKDVYLGGVNYATASAYFSNEEEIEKLRKGREYTVAGKLKSGNDYQKDVKAFGFNDKSRTFVITLSNCIVIE